MTPAPDQAARERALDVERSLIVQAPAGSGKTTLLVQRYLRLLGRAGRPEEILAITFTRKAAAEMRERVLQALRSQTPDAAAALQRNREAGWQLLEQPSRLKIQTIDSFASALVRQLPLTAAFRPGAELVEDASDAYRQAVDRLFRRLYQDDPLGPELAAVLALLDNDYATTRVLLAGMLARRDQWLDLVRGVVQLGRHEPDAVRRLIESALRELGRRVVGELDACLDDAERHILHDALGRAADRLGERIDDDHGLYRLAGRLLVTGQGTLRRRLTRQHGFPPDEPLRKAALMELIERLDARGCAPLLDNLRVLPAATVNEADADALTSLCITLLLAALELDALLLEQGQADFTQLVLAASRALADGDAPTELALALDYRIRHLLVDEFQDTSESQLRFFRLLVQGWSPGDGNTFFAVGDPMQSIYRFRNADVRVFYEAWHRGIGPVALEPVRLSANFRASPPLVDWYNRTFATVMGPTDDPLLGRVAYSPAEAARTGAAQSTAGAAVHCELLAAGSDQSAAVAERIQRLHADDPTARIAVLVRSRTHLGALLPALRRAGITWRATDIEPLAARPVVQDLVCLARVLADPHDRLAWFAVLRAPWVGLDHPDLEAFAGCPDLSEALDSPAVLERLSADGQRRIDRLRHALERGRRLRYEAPPRTVLETTWICCGGVDAYPGGDHLQDAQRLLALVDDLGPRGDEPDVLTRAAERLFAEAGGTAAVEIMTIHKAKGLEFDHVVLPFLERTTRSTEPPMLLWRREGDGLLLAARRSGELYRWLAREDRARERHERERLLYVACTRARETLHLFAEGAPRAAGDSLLALLWPALDAAERPEDAAASAETRRVAEASPSYLTLPEHTPPRLRLPADYDWQPPQFEFPQLAAHSAAVPEDDAALGHLPDVAFGTLMHETLQHLCSRNLPDDVDGYTLSRHRLWREALRSAGVAPGVHDEVLARLEEHLRRVLNDPDGRRILAARRSAYSELAVTEAGESGVLRRFVDRTFVDDDGYRWIVDYKTGNPPPGVDVDAFVSAQRQHHAAQLQGYAAALRAFFPEPFRLALYFTALPRLVMLEQVRESGG